MPSNKQIIPIMHCFNDNYVIPASVSFLSMLENANPAYFYRLYVLHTDISEQNQNILNSIVAKFKNASLEFVDMNHKFENVFDRFRVKGHYTKEVLYKLLAPSIFPQYEQIVITDVDVVFSGDIADIWGGGQGDEYIAGISYPNSKGSWLEIFMQKTYEVEFSSDERARLLIGGGLLVMNLKKMRDDDMEAKLVEYLEANAYRLKQAEQDVLNIVLYPKIKLLPIKAMVCTYLYDIYETQANLSDTNRAWLKEATENPIQIHYAGAQKPWNTPTCTKSDIWFAYLTKTPFFYDIMRNVAEPKLPDCKFYLFNKIEILKIKNNKARLFGCIPVLRKVK